VTARVTHITSYMCSIIRRIFVNSTLSITYYMLKLVFNTCFRMSLLPCDSFYVSTITAIHKRSVTDLRLH